MLFAVVGDVSLGGCDPKDLRLEREEGGGSGYPGEEQCDLWRQACPPLRYLGPGKCPPVCAGVQEMEILVINKVLTKHFGLVGLS